MKRFAEDEGTQCDSEFLALAFPSTLENIRQINNRWNTFNPKFSLRRQSEIFHNEVGSDYTRFCQRVGWLIDGVYQSKEQLQSRLESDLISGLPDGFLPFLFHHNPTDTADNLQSIYVAWLVRIQEGLSP